MIGNKVFHAASLNLEADAWLMSAEIGLVAAILAHTHAHVNYLEPGLVDVKKGGEIQLRSLKKEITDLCQAGYRVLFIPINVLGAHWTLLVIDNGRHEIIYFDSMTGFGGANIANSICSAAKAILKEVPGDEQRWSTS